jgi:hypothetical protein
MNLTRSDWQEIHRGWFVGGAVAVALPLWRVFLSGAGSWGDIVGILVAAMVGSLLGASIAVVHIRCK